MECKSSLPVERIHYLQEWANSGEYRDIRQGNYQRINVDTTVKESTETEAERLRREIAELQAEIERRKQSGIVES